MNYFNIVLLFNTIMPWWVLRCVAFSALVLNDPEFYIFNFLFLFFLVVVVV